MLEEEDPKTTTCFFLRSIKNSFWRKIRGLEDQKGCFQRKRWKNGRTSRSHYEQRESWWKIKGKLSKPIKIYEVGERRET